VRDLRRDNRSVLLWSLFSTQPCSRQELSAATGLSAASVSTVVRELISEGIAIEAGSVGSDGGRPRILLRMNPRYGRVIGIDVGETRVSAEAFDLTMTRQARADRLLHPGAHGAPLIADAIASCLTLLADNVDRLADNADDLADNADGLGNTADGLAGNDLAGSADGLAGSAAGGLRAIAGIGIGVPGMVERNAAGALLVHGQAYGWDAVPLEDMLRERLPGIGVPLLIDNGARAMGQAELWFGAGRGTRRAVVCLIGSGVGASVITGGSGGGAVPAEWGHMAIVAGGRPCRCGSRGCLEAYVGAEAILDRYSDPLPGDDEEAALQALVTSSSRRAAEILDETAVFLGIGIANLINLVNPDRVILGGWAGLILAERMLPAIREAARQHSLRYRFTGTSIEPGKLGADAVALGAATLPIERFLNGTLATQPAARSTRAAG
jgi:predicted NBD/HSP70 family sugar kinase/biotin operon repressor